MAGCPRVVATVEQREQLSALAGSSDREEADREEADRARAILLSLQGWSSVRIGEAFSVETACAIGAGRSVARGWRVCAPARRRGRSR
jgi:hypothetical protein